VLHPALVQFPLPLTENPGIIHACSVFDKIFENQRILKRSLFLPHDMVKELEVIPFLCMGLIIEEASILIAH
jgi:hypothetical protein